MTKTIFISLLYLLGVAAFATAGETVHFKSKDGVELYGVLVKADNPRATLMLLPMLGRSKASWSEMQDALVERNFSSFAIDLRGHGESTIKKGREIHWRTFSNREFGRMLHDVEAAAQYLIGEQGIDPESLYLMGASIGANTVLKYAANHPEIPGVILLSAGLDYRGVETVPAAKRFGKRPILYVVSQEDLNSLESTRHLRRWTPNYKLIELESSGHGTRMFENGILMDKILNWLDSQTAGEIDDAA